MHGVVLGLRLVPLVGHVVTRQERHGFRGFLETDPFAREGVADVIPTALTVALHCREGAAQDTPGAFPDVFGLSRHLLVLVGVLEEVRFQRLQVFAFCLVEVTLRMELLPCGEELIAECLLGHG